MTGEISHSPGVITGHSSSLALLILLSRCANLFDFPSRSFFHFLETNISKILDYSYFFPMAPDNMCTLS